MAEALLYTKDNILDEMADYCGYGRDYGAATTSQKARLDAYWKEGVHQLLYPAMIDRAVAHDWSWLSPEAELSLSSSTGANAATGSSGTTLEADDTIFTDGMLRATVTFTSSGNTYEIESVTDTDTVVLTESLETADGVGDAFTVTDYYRYDLPADFGGMVGEVTFTDDTSVGPLERVSEGAIRYKHQTGTYSGRPVLYAVRWKQQTLTATQRQELLVWPSPDSSYTIKYRYNILQEAIAVGEYPPGGSRIGAVLLASCRAVCELRLNGQPGPEHQFFMQRLMRAIQDDRQHSSPHTYGVLRGAEDTSWARGARRTVEIDTITYDGTTYSGS